MNLRSTNFLLPDTFFIYLTLIKLKMKLDTFPRTEKQKRRNELSSDNINYRDFFMKQLAIQLQFLYRCLFSVQTRLM